MDQQDGVPNCDAIMRRQRFLCERWHVDQQREYSTGLMNLIELNHSANFDFWHEEDIARRDDLPPERIRLAKRKIDSLNQQRNDLTEQMDAQLWCMLDPPAAHESCPSNSETPGMMIDRLSILALKEYHMAEESQRSDASLDHQRICTERLQAIRIQQTDLLDALRLLFSEISSRKRTFKLYRQFKMYNDRELNPELRITRRLSHE